MQAIQNFFVRSHLTVTNDGFIKPVVALNITRIQPAALGFGYGFNAVVATKMWITASLTLPIAGVLLASTITLIAATVLFIRSLKKQIILNENNRQTLESLFKDSKIDLNKIQETSGVVKTTSDTMQELVNIESPTLMKYMNNYLEQHKGPLNVLIIPLTQTLSENKSKAFLVLRNPSEDNNASWFIDIYYKFNNNEIALVQQYINKVSLDVPYNTDESSFLRNILTGNNGEMHDHGVRNFTLRNNS